MADHRPPHGTDWVRYFERRGHRAVRPLAAGIEGTVHRLGDGLVAKVWTGRPPTELDLTRQVYADLARHRLPFRTPEIVDAEEHEGTVITYERELPGSPLAPDSAHQAPPYDLGPTVPGALLTVLRGLASVPGTDAMRRLTVQGDDRPLWHGHARFPDALAALTERAARRHPAPLAAQVPGLVALADALPDRLRALPDSPVTAVHGDLVPPNIHVDGSGRPVAVLDFGFFTTAGDPAFDAAVTAAVHDMYGPHAAAHTAVLTRHFAIHLGHDPRTLALYQCAYALATYDLFSSDGSDGHFQWCAALLRRAEPS